MNVTTKEITNRFDFKGSHVVIELNKKDFKINIETEDEMKMRQLCDVLISRAINRELIRWHLISVKNLTKAVK